MNWNYRLCKETVLSDGDSVDIFSIREVYYEDGVISSVSSNPITIESDSKDGVVWILEKINKSLAKDTVDLNSLEFWNK